MAMVLTALVMALLIAVGVHSFLRLAQQERMRVAETSRAQRVDTNGSGPDPGGT